MTTPRERAQDLLVKLNDFITQVPGADPWIETRYAIEDILAYAEQVRREAIREASEVVCYGCRLGVPFEPDGGKCFHYDGVDKEREGYGWCQSVGIRSLLSAAPSDTKGDL